MHGSPTTTRGTLRIAETFASRQGEGLLTGTESFFIRTSGCNLRCWFCDTPYASWQPQGETVSIETLVEQVEEANLRHVVLTGGEPLLFESIVPLCRELRVKGYHVTIETAGTIDRSPNCDLMSISPKLASSAPAASRHQAWTERHHERRMPLAILRKLIDEAPAVQLKFVVDSPLDFPELTSIVHQLGVPPEVVWVMPQGVTVESIDKAAQWLRPWCQSVGFHYCDRMQIRWYGNRRGT